MTASTGENARIGVVMGSDSDWETMSGACSILREFGVPFEARMVSAHRMPDAMFASEAYLAPCCAVLAQRFGRPVVAVMVDARRAQVPISASRVRADVHGLRAWLAPEVVQTSSMDCGPAALKCLLEIGRAHV